VLLEFTAPINEPGLGAEFLRAVGIDVLDDVCQIAARFRIEQGHLRRAEYQPLKRGARVHPVLDIPVDCVLPPRFWVAIGALPPAVVWVAADLAAKSFELSDEALHRHVVVVPRCDARVYRAFVPHDGREDGFRDKAVPHHMCAELFDDHRRVLLRVRRESDGCPSLRERIEERFQQKSDLGILQRNDRAGDRRDWVIDDARTGDTGILAFAQPDLPQRTEESDCHLVVRVVRLHVCPSMFAGAGFAPGPDLFQSDSSCRSRSRSIRIASSMPASTYRSTLRL